MRFSIGFLAPWNIQLPHARTLFVCSADTWHEHSRCGKSVNRGKIPTHCRRVVLEGRCGDSPRLHHMRFEVSDIRQSRRFEG